MPFLLGEKKHSEDLRDGHGDLRARAAQCKKCALHKKRDFLVWAEYPSYIECPLMFVGEAPGEEEDKCGRPFVGRAGKKLQEIISSGITLITHVLTGKPPSTPLSYMQVYITNVVKCRPPNNRDPEKEEIEACLPYLFRQVEMVKPKVIIALGAHAAQALTGRIDPIGHLRGNLLDLAKKKDLFDPPKVCPTYHPSYLLRSYSDENRSKVTQDLFLAMEFLNEHGVLPWWCE
jgi:uracil-DNA glycosylase family 4